ncbi:unnamed protein product, partial [Haemonchus placei]|uniref:RGS domain-containing protein n=1 Tax=Haemonchus placei TaxID=6290 RepID=A0A0N4VS13_HAEPC
QTTLHVLDVNSGGESPVGQSGAEEPEFSNQKEFGYVDFASRKDRVKTFKIHVSAKITNVDTTVYRSAIWNYIHALFGIRHDDYDYAKVNTLLSREMKTFVKMAACYPHRITEDARASVMKDFKMSEKIHVMLLIMEARLQASMLYFTRGLTNHYSRVKKPNQPKRLD